MSVLRGFAIVASAVLVLAPAVVSAEEVTLLLEDGETISGEFQGLGDGVVRIGVAGESRSIPFDRIDPTHVHLMWEPRVSTAAERLRLGEFCLARRLPALASGEFRKIVDDPDLGGLAREGLEAAQEAIAEALYLEAQELALAGARRDERAVLERLVESHPGSRAALLARAELALLDRAAERRLERRRKAEEREAAERARRAEILDRYLTEFAARAAAIRDEAATSTKFARGHRLLLDAIEAYEGLIPYANELAKYDPDRAAGWSTRIKTDLVGIYVMLTVVELERKNSRQAMHWIAQTLLLDPDNERAKELRDIAITYGIEEDPYRMPIGELSRLILRRRASNEMIRAFVARTGENGLSFLRAHGIIPP